MRDGVDWEIRHHLDERIDELVAQGHTRAAAEREALDAFGDLEHVRRDVTDIDRGIRRRDRMKTFVETVVQDVKYGARGLVRDRSFAAAVIVALGLGIGAAAAMFAVVDALLLRPLPYAEPEELYGLTVWTADGSFGRPYMERSVAQEWAAQSDYTEGILLHARRNVLHTGDGEPRTLAAVPVSATFHEMLGVAPVIGRGLVAADAQPGAPPVVVVSYDLWRGPLQAADDVAGRLIRLDGSQYTIVGVMPEGFKFPEYSTTEVWAPIGTDGTVLGTEITDVSVLARVAPEDTAAAQAQSRALARSIYTANDASSGESLKLESFNERRAGRDVLQSVALLSGAVFLILLVAGFNMVSLLLVRAAARAREIAVRLALGAPRMRLVRQLVTEAMLLALVSGAVAVLLAFVTMRAAQGAMPRSLTFFAPHAFAVEQRTLFFTAVVAIGCGLVFGLLPAWRAVRASNPTKAGNLTVRGAGAQRSILRRMIVVGEVAISVTLLVGAVLLIRSFDRLMSVDPGFTADGLAMMTLSIGTEAHPAAERGSYLRRLEARIEAVPGVQGATVADGLPPKSGFHFGTMLRTEDGQPLQVQPELLPFASVPPDFLDVLGIPLMQGRAFRSDDRDNDVAIIDVDLARALWPNGSAIGRRFRVEDDAPWRTVVGVIPDVKLMGPDDRTGDYELLYPATHDDMRAFVGLAIRTGGDVDALLPAIRRAVYDVDPEQPIEDLSSAADRYIDAVALPRFLRTLMTGLAVLALVLAAVGLYGVLAYGVAQRRSELGVRMALGARPGDVRRMIVGEGLLLGGLGAVLGLIGARALGRFIEATLYGVQPGDPSTLALVAAIMMAVALAACWWPARTATAVEPAIVLRAD